MHIVLKDGKKIFLAAPALDSLKQELYDELAAKFADRNVRAIAVTVDEDVFGPKQRTILCDDIREICM